MDSRALFDRVAGWAGKTFSGRLTRQARRAAIRQHRRLHKQADRLAPESLEQRALLAAVVAGYEVVNDWGGGFQGGLTLANQDTQSYGDWTVSFDYGADITSIWDARVVSREGSRYTISNAGYNAAFDPGRTIAFGFIGTPTAAGSAADAPTNFTINGEP
ncbi:MAG: cellulose binding domain-containing protein, partial [Planctomycetota bacterium]|nr:cellulose binding domain-containing protein [Planctomycetota bacterium]